MQEIKKINLSLEFDYYSLGDLVKIKYGKNQKKVQDDTNGQYPIFGTGGLMGYSIEYLYDKPSVLIGRKGSIEKVRYIEEPFWTVDTLFYTEVNDKIVIPKFLYYVLFLIDLSRYNEGTSIPSLRTETLNSLDLPIPNLDYQNRVLSILSKIDKKIEINEKINKNLFNIIDFIFKDYVGDYEDLEIVSLSENTQEIIRGFNSKYVEKSNIKNFNQKVNKGTFLEKQHFKYLDENIEIPKAKFAKKRDVLVNSLGDGTVGRPHYYNEDTDNVVVDQHITIIRANEDLIPSTYIYEYLKNSTGQYHLDSLISGSTGMLMLNISEIRNLKIPILDKKNLREFDTTVTPLFDKITKNFEEIYCLSKLRDTLLPKLMSGEIDVSEVNCDLELKYNYMKYLFNQIHTPMSKSVV